MQSEFASALGTCVQQALELRFQWAMFVIGIGAATLAGCAGLLLALQSGLARIGKGLRVRPKALATVLIQATRLTLFVLGAGLAVGAWGAWQALGTWTIGDPREAWMAGTLLLATTSLLAWRLERHSTGWAVALALLTAAAAWFGWLAAPALQHILWA